MTPAYGRSTRLAALLLGLGIVAGCGSGAAEMSSETAAVLGDRVSLIRGTLEERNWARAREQLGQLRELVRREQAAGHLGEQRATDIVAAARQLSKDLPRPAPEPDVAVPPRPDAGSDQNTHRADEAPEQPSERGKGKHKKDERQNHGKKHGHWKDHGGEEDDDDDDD